MSISDTDNFYPRIYIIAKRIRTPIEFKELTGEPFVCLINQKFRASWRRRAMRARRADANGTNVQQRTQSAITTKFNGSCQTKFPMLQPCGIRVRRIIHGDAAGCLDFKGLASALIMQDYPAAPSRGSRLKLARTETHGKTSRSP